MPSISRNPQPTNRVPIPAPPPLSRIEWKGDLVCQCRSRLVRCIAPAALLWPRHLVPTILQHEYTGHLLVTTVVALSIYATGPAVGREVRAPSSPPAPRLLAPLADLSGPARTECVWEGGGVATCWCAALVFRALAWGCKVGARPEGVTWEQRGGATWGRTLRGSRHDYSSMDTTRQAWIGASRGLRGCNVRDAPLGALSCGGHTHSGSRGHAPRGGRVGRGDAT